MKFKTERLEVRPFEPEDLNDVFKIYSDPLTCQYLLHGAWTKENMVEKFDEKLNQQTLTKNSAVSLAVNFDGVVIGDISVWYTGMKETIEIGYSFSSVYSGKGYAAEAVRRLIELLFTAHKVHRIQANLDARNKRSAKLCERIGMRKEAHFVQDYWNKGEWTDSMVYGMLETDL